MSRAQFRDRIINQNVFTIKHCFHSLYGLDDSNQKTMPNPHEMALKSRQSALWHQQFPTITRFSNTAGIYICVYNLEPASHQPRSIYIVLQFYNAYIRIPCGLCNATHGCGIFGPHLEIGAMRMGAENPRRIENIWRFVCARG